MAYDLIKGIKIKNVITGNQFTQGNAGRAYGRR